jgi:hypothetical protein
VTSRRGYTHHGIYIGEGRVVHYAGLSRSWDSGAVEEVRMTRFTSGRAISIKEHAESSYSPQQIVERARSRLGENRYHVLKNNCEHFCNWCITGRSTSTQVSRPLTFSLAALAELAIRVHRVPQVLVSLHEKVARGRGISLGMAGYSRVVASGSSTCLVDRMASPIRRHER